MHKFNCLFCVKSINVIAVIIIAITITMAQGSAIWDGTTDVSWYNASQAEFTIATAEQLAGLASLVNNGTNDFEGKTIILKNNLYLDNRNWTPIGGNIGFLGIFEGNNYSISDLFISSKQEYVGLFGHVDYGGQIKNLIVNVTEIITTSDEGVAGGLVGLYGSTKSIANCGVIIKEKIHSTLYSGGLVGLSNIEMTINNAYVIGNVSSSNFSYSAHSGGLVGWGNSITINNSYATGNVSAFCGGDLDEEPYSFAGGLVGGGDIMVTVNNSYTISNISASSTEVALSGGIAGFAGGQGITSNSYASGTVTATGLEAGAGGIFGNVNDSRTNISVFYNSQGANQATGGGESIGILAKNSEQLKAQNTFLNWDFIDIWGINSEINNGYPYLRVIGDNPVVSISNAQRSDSRCGIRFTNNVVSKQAEINIILPNNEKTAEMKTVIYDNIGNVVFTSVKRGDKAVWDLTNNTGRKVANGTYLLVVEVKGVSGRSYMYSAKLGVSGW
ncbi:MAG: hypothetical protein LBH98_06455 [Chitinispirillales bacterium]|nr:hypothetical protein [Chitinispirillales bacterium]